MKLSTRSRYGTRMMIDMAQRYGQGAIHIGGISERLNVSVKYLEQLIIPLKKAGYIKSVRGPKGGHMLSRPPGKISVGEIVEVLEGGICLADCVENPEACEKAGACLTRGLWKEATRAVREELHSTSLGEMVKTGQKLFSEM